MTYMPSEADWHPPLEWRDMGDLILKLSKADDVKCIMLSHANMAAIDYRLTNGLAPCPVRRAYQHLIHLAQTEEVYLCRTSTEIRYDLIQHFMGKETNITRNNLKHTTGKSWKQYKQWATKHKEEELERLLTQHNNDA